MIFFLGPNHMVRQARTGDTVLAKSREMTGRTQTLPWPGGWGRTGKDDRKQNTLAPQSIYIYRVQSSVWRLPKY